MRPSDNGFRIGAGRPRSKPWEQKSTLVVKLTPETYQRIERLAKREGRSKSEALELLIRTPDAEKIEPTLPVDYSKVIHPQRGYAITQILDS